ncbi:MAG TPA: DNA translocase FtsK 4TM domain-containing protein [Acetobacteraceae bacterium]
MATALQARRFASPEINALIRTRLAQLGGLALALCALLLLAALASYNPHDPSLNTATSQRARNLAGPAGALVADLLLQGIGAASALPGLAMLAWAFRTVTGMPLRFGLRLTCTLLALPVVAAVLAAAAETPGLQIAAAWPTTAGLGGAVGSAVASYAANTGYGLLGQAGAMVMLGLGGLLALVLVVLGLGLTAGEWRAASQGAVGGAVGMARGSMRGGRGVAGLLGGAARGLAMAGRGASGAFAGLVAALARRQADPEPLPAPAGPPPAALPLAAIPAPPAPAEPPIRPAAASIAVPLPLPPAVTPPSAAPAAAPAVSPIAIPVAMPHATPSVARKAGYQDPAPPAESGWQFPPLSLLSRAPARAGSGPSADALQENARLLETVLNDYGVQGAIREIRPGPVVTLYELEPAPGIRSARVIGLADDVARSLCVTAVRIATVPGRNVIGIEVPNARRETVFLSELLDCEDWRTNPGRLALALGKDIGGTPVIADLARMPHLLIAGTTGSGKSVGINAMILSILFRLSPDQCRLIMIDPKMLELSVYEGIPHLLAPVVTEPAKAVTALKWTTREMERRYRAMSQLGVRNVGGYNEKVEEYRRKGEVPTRRVQTGFDSETGKPTFEEQPLTLKTLPYIVVVIDEMADLMMVAGKEVEAAVQRLAQMARAAGIHVIMATQRPSVDVITGTIKANFPTRISFQVISKFDSRTILGEQGAEQLLGQGDLLHMQGGGRIARVHGPFVRDQEVEDIVAFLRSQAEPTYDDEVTEGEDDEDGGGVGGGGGGGGGGSGGDGEKNLFDQAVAVVTREGKASTSFIQRHLSIGYNRAAKLIEQMEKEGVITAANHVGKREVLARVTRDDE